MGFNSENIDTKNRKWLRELESAARKTIGKTTIKEGVKEKSSETVKNLNDQKKALRSRIQYQTNIKKFSLDRDFCCKRVCSSGRQL